MQLLEKGKLYKVFKIIRRVDSIILEDYKFFIKIYNNSYDFLMKIFLGILLVY